MSEVKTKRIYVIHSIILCSIFLVLSGCGWLPSSKMERAKRLIDEGQFTKAIEIIDQVVRKDARNATALALRGQATERIHGYEAALKDFEAALEIDPNLLEAWIGKSNLLARRGDLDGRDQGSTERCKGGVETCAYIFPNGTNALLQGKLSGSYEVF